MPSGWSADDVAQAITFVIKGGGGWCIMWIGYVIMIVKQGWHFPFNIVLRRKSDGRHNSKTSDSVG
jgi:hypothetical protein